MRLASKYVADGITVSEGFNKEISDHIRYYHPHSIIETGTYIGTGSTNTILNTLHQCSYGGMLISIEANKKYINNAIAIQSKHLYDNRVIFLNGISLPKDWIPEVIDDDFPDDIYTDYEDSSEYLKELPDDVPYDMLGRAMNLTDYSADMYVLDSAGHLGTAEFLYILEKQKKPTYFFIDDTNHRKHFKTIKIAQSDSRLEILSQSKEKFGHAIIYFNP